MGRQAYLNRLALGRSPYEPPETATVDPSSPVRRVSSVHADNYMQQYDARGHPVNPQSKALGRELRRAKNDILSTMGVVVSGEDRNASSSNEQQKINQIAAENDFGLLISSLDQLFVFLGTWWSSSFTARIQTYRHYNHAALLDVIRSERGSTGILGFYTAGMPALGVSYALAIARDNPLKRVFAAARTYCLDLTGHGGLSFSIRSFFLLAYSAMRGSFLLLSVETYMYSLLQTLSLVPSDAIPNLSLLIPFGEESLIQLPPLPTDISGPSVGGFLLRLLASPGVLTFLFAFYLRPELEDRIYRLIRRQLPKPTLVDEHSIKVAYEENLIDWMVPTLGRRSSEEMHRAKLTLLDDIKYELAAFKGWVFSLFGLLSKRDQLDPLTTGSSDRERLESLRNSIETLQHQLDNFQPRGNRADREDQISRSRPLETLTGTNAVDVAPANLPAVAESTPLSETELALGMSQVLTNENRMSQSPGEMSSDYFSEMATLGRTSAPSTITRSQSQPSNPQTEEHVTRDRQNSRSNTLFSRPSSPETSPPTSPRVRASLIHQSSDIITMQLELLGNRTRNSQNRPSTSGIPGLSSDYSGLRSSSNPVDRRSLAEFLEALILSQAQRQATQHPPQADNDYSSNITGGASFTTAQEVPTGEGEQPNYIQEAMAAEHPALNAAEETPGLAASNILPDGVEEPNEEQATIHPQALESIDPPAVPTDPILGAHEPISRAAVHPDPSQSITAHRVTLLSAYPVDSLATHLAAIISTIILSPLETLCLRSLAHSYLSTHPSVSVSISDLHPTNIWLGGRSWSDRAAYAGRMVLMRGMQAALRAGFWGFLVGSTMRIGRKWCGWGTL